MYIKSICLYYIFHLKKQRKSKGGKMLTIGESKEEYIHLVWLLSVWKLKKIKIWVMWERNPFFLTM